MSVERKKLVWEIKEELHALTARELFELTRHIELPGLDSSTVNKSDEESCFNYICSYMQSETLLVKEDEGFVQLLEFSLRDLSLLQRREFKIHGGKVGAYASDISYSSLCKQIEEGLMSNHTESEIIQGIFCIIKPGQFKDTSIWIK